MEKYVKAQMEVIEFEAEDVITTSCSAGLPICTGTDYDDLPDCTNNVIWGD